VSEPDRPKRVLFVCVENSNRSQMAEAFARMYGGGRVEAHSAGNRPTGKVNPRAVRFMSERGYDLSTHTSKGLGPFNGQEIDAAVAMGCRDAATRLTPDGGAFFHTGPPLPRCSFQESLQNLRGRVTRHGCDPVCQLDREQRAFVLPAYKPRQGRENTVEPYQIGRSWECGVGFVDSRRHVQDEVGAGVQFQVDLLAPVGLEAVGVGQVRRAVNFPTNIPVRQHGVSRLLTAGLGWREPGDCCQVVGECACLLLTDDVDQPPLVLGELEEVAYPGHEFPVLAPEGQRAVLDEERIAQLVPVTRLLASPDRGEQHQV
jgi:Low molecular weight phosphotyrosine protein phosphatase